MIKSYKQFVVFSVFDIVIVVNIFKSIGYLFFFSVIVIISNFLIFDVLNDFVFIIINSGSYVLNISSVCVIGLFLFCVQLFRIFYFEITVFLCIIFV